ncbi:MAG: RNA polymerase sigma-70 factor [Bacteroidota bacterium]
MKLGRDINKNQPDITTPEGFRDVYESCAEQMFAICFNRTRDKEVSKDIVQEIFKSLWERRHTLKIQDTIKHYLLRATKFELLDHYRQLKRDQRHIQLAVAPLAQTARTTEEALDFKQLKGQIDEVVEELPAQCQRVFILSREKGMSNKEIASSLDISVKTVEAHISKALGTLRGVLPLRKLS